jgi:hypothetical protein
LEIHFDRDDRPHGRDSIEATAGCKGREKTGHGKYSQIQFLDLVSENAKEVTSYEANQPTRD